MATSAVQRYLRVFLPLSFTLALVGCRTKLIYPIAPGCSSTAAQAGNNRTGLEMIYAFPAEALINSYFAAAINPATGGWSLVSVGTVPFLGSSGVTAANSQFLYVSVGPDIFAYSINQSNGTFTPIAGSPFSLGVGHSFQAVVATPNGQFLYAADIGSIDLFSVDHSTGTLTEVWSFDSGNDVELAVDPFGKFLYASDSNAPGGVEAFSITCSGTLTPVPGSPFAIPGQTVANSEPFGIVDTGSFIYVTLAATNQVTAFSVDSDTGALTAVTGSPFASGIHPAVLAVAGNFVYVVNSSNGSISGYSTISSSGALTPISGFPFAEDAGTIVADPSGKYLYVSTSFAVLGFNINSARGVLTQGAAGISNDGALWMTIVQLPSSAAQ
jgi:6-phosphogluconolactonase